MIVRRTARRALPMLAISVSGGLLALACAAPLAIPPAPAPEEIPSLEARLAAAPLDQDAAVQLGAAYRGAGRLEEAREVLEGARIDDPDDPAAIFYLGLTYEDLERFGDARTLYQEYVELSGDGALRDQLESRIELMRRRELQQVVEIALAQEAQLDAQPDPATVAVFPFVSSGADEEVRPLGRALTAFLATDLGQIERLRLLERVLLHALMSEIALAETDLVDPRTAARGGRIIGAGTIVQGQLQGDLERLVVDAAVVDVRDGPGGPLTLEEAADRFLDMEKALVFQVLGELNIALTPTEEERIGRRPTQNLQAILAYGRGLEADDGGLFAEALGHFQQAAQLDPSFAAAQVAAAQAAQVQASISTTTADVATQALTPEGPGDLLGLDDLLSDITNRDPAQEALGTEGLMGSPSVIDVILRRPTGGDR